MIIHQTYNTKIGQMQLERVLILVEQRTRVDGSCPGHDIRHIEGPLKSSGIVGNIDILYYNDYTPNCDNALINYCLQKKPQVVLLSLQNVALRKTRGPTPNAIWKITHQLGIPTVAFWFDIDADIIAKVLERYRHTITLNVLLCASASSHKALPLDTNYVHTGATFDERLFNIPEGVRDIPVGFLSSLIRNRAGWIAGLRKFGVSPYMAGGAGTTAWMPYQKYLKLMSRLKIILNFSLKCPGDLPVPLSDDRGRARNILYLFMPRFRPWFLTLVKNPAKSKHIIPVFKNIAQVLLEKPRYFVQGQFWEALWLRTFVLTESNPTTSKYFEPYTDYVPFTSVKDLVDKIRYYLENNEERDRIRTHGRATVEKYYNARIYWENIFETIGVQSTRRHYYHPGEIWNKAYFNDWYLSKKHTEEL